MLLLNPPDHLVLLRREDITPETAQALVTLCIPAMEVCEQAVDSTQEIKPGESCAVKNLGEDGGSEPVELLGVRAPRCDRNATLEDVVGFRLHRFDRQLFCSESFSNVTLRVGRR